MSLTPQQKNVLDFIEEYTDEHGFAPTQNEIANHFGFKSLGTVQDYLNRLRQKGYLESTWNGKRAIRLKQKKHELPLLGRVAAGSPIEAILHDEFIEVPPSMTAGPGKFFALQVRGDSMIEDGICDGDYVIIRKQAKANNGETVIAMIDNEATIKRFEQHGGGVALHPANSRFQTIHVSPNQDFRIEGIMIGVIRLK